MTTAGGWKIIRKSRRTLQDNSYVSMKMTKTCVYWYTRQYPSRDLTGTVPVGELTFQNSLIFTRPISAG